MDDITGFYCIGFMVYLFMRVRLSTFFQSSSLLSLWSTVSWLCLVVSLGFCAELLLCLLTRE